MFLDGPKDKGCIQLHCSDTPQDLRFPQTIPDAWSWLRGKPFAELLQAETLGAARGACASWGASDPPPRETCGYAFRR